MSVDWVPMSDLCTPDRVPVAPGSKDSCSLPYIGLEHIEPETGRIIALADPSSTKGLCFRFDSRHVLYGKLRPYLNKVALPTTDGKCSTEAIPLKPVLGVSRDYLAVLLKRPQTVEFVMSEITGSRMPRADIDKLLSMKVPFLSGEEQRKLCGLTDAIEGKLNDVVNLLKLQFDAVVSLRRELRANIIGLLDV